MINIEQFIADIKGMTVLELADLVKAIEDESVSYTHLDVYKRQRMNSAYQRPHRPW